MRFRLLIALLVVAAWSGSACAATVEWARNSDTGRLVPGLKVEGNIVPGDTEKLLAKLLDAYLALGPYIDTVYLLSRGGSADEAMKMGAMIRRLRLKTEAPATDYGSGKPARCGVSLTDKGNCICASACFLAYAGGVSRSGDYVALHRPYIPREEAGKLSDVEFETAQKEEIAKVAAYLKDMDVDQHWIDRMIGTSSQSSYVPTRSEAENRDYHLMGVVPAIEEMQLAKCPAHTGESAGNIRPTTAKDVPFTAEERSLMSHVAAIFDCQKRALDDIRKAAFDREIDDRYVRSTCSLLSPQEAKILREFSDATPESREITAPLIAKDREAQECRKRVLDKPVSEARKREGMNAREAEKTIR